MLKFWSVIIGNSMEVSPEDKIEQHLRTLTKMVHHSRASEDPNGKDRWPGFVRQVHGLRQILGNRLINDEESPYYKAYLINIVLTLFHYDFALLKKYKRSVRALYKAQSNETEEEENLGIITNATYRSLFHILTEAEDIAFKKYINRKRKGVEQEA